MKPIKVVMAGNGHDHSAANFRAMKHHPEAFDVLGVCDLIPGKNEETYAGAKRFTLEEVLTLPDLDAVVIESGKNSEVYYGQKFAEKGIPIFLDKPGSSNVEEYNKLLDIVEEKKLPFGLGYVYRFNPMVQKALGLKNSGELGDIYSVEAHMSVFHDQNKRRWLKTFKGGMMFYLGCHIIDAACLFMGFPNEVIPLSTATGNDGIDSEDFGCAILKYNNGSAYIRTCASEVNGFARRSITVTGTKGTVQIHPTERHIINDDTAPDLVAEAHITLLKDNPNQWGMGSGTDYKSEPFNRYAPMLLQFAAQVRGEEGYVMPLDYERKLMKTIALACGADNEIKR